MVTHHSSTVPHDGCCTALGHQQLWAIAKRMLPSSLPGMEGNGFSSPACNVYPITVHCLNMSMDHQQTTTVRCNCQHPTPTAWTRSTSSNRDWASNYLETSSSVTSSLLKKSKAEFLRIKMVPQPFRRLELNRCIALFSNSIRVRHSEVSLPLSILWKVWGRVR